MRLKMFHVPKPRKFGYTPIYYNSEQEETVTREKRKKTDSEEEKDGQNKYWQYNMDRITRKKSINITMYLFIAALLLYLIFFS